MMTDTYKIGQDFLALGGLKGAVDLIKKARKNANITDQEMADKVGLSIQQFEDYLNKRAIASKSLIEKLLSAYNIVSVSQSGVDSFSPPSPIEPASTNKD